METACEIREHAQRMYKAFSHIIISKVSLKRRSHALVLQCNACGQTDGQLECGICAHFYRIAVGCQKCHLPVNVSLFLFCTLFIESNNLDARFIAVEGLALLCFFLNCFFSNTFVILNCRYVNSHFREPQRHCRLRNPGSATDLMCNV